MHLWDFERAGIQIWDFWMLKMSDIGNHSESYTIPSSDEIFIPNPTKPCVTLYKEFVKGVSFLQNSPFGPVHVLQQGAFKHILIK